MYHWLKAIERLPGNAIILLLPMLVALIAFVDYQTGHEVAFAIFYLLPATIAAYVFGKRVGLVMEPGCTYVWVPGCSRGWHGWRVYGRLEVYSIGRLGQ